MLFQSRDGTLCFPLLHLFTRAISEVAHAFGVRAGAVGFAFDERGAFAVASTLHGLAGGGVHCQHVVAIHFDAGDAIRRAAGCHAGIARDTGEWNLGGELVVLAHEQHGQLPDARHVQAFVKRAVVRRAIAEESDTDIACLHDQGTIARASGLQDAGADDAAGAHHADLRRKQMHGATATARAAGLATKEFRHELARLHAFGERMSMAAVRAEDGVRFMQMRAHARGDGFLADIGVAGTVDESALMRFCESLLHHADDEHGAVELKRG